MMRDDYLSPVPDRFQWRNWAADPEGMTGDPLLAFINDELFPALKELKPTGARGDRRRVVKDVFEDAYNYMKSGHLLRQVVNKINELDFNNLTERQHFGDEIGRASCRERVCEDVSIPVVAEKLNKKKKNK